MIFQTLKRLALIVLVTSGLTGCTQFLGASAGDSIDANAQGRAAKAPHSKVAHRSLLNTLLSNDSSSSASDLYQGDSGGSNGNLWNHMRSEFQLPSADDKPAVREQIAWFAHHQQYLNRTVQRAAPYMFYILQETEKRNLPAELVLLPVLESAYNPSAISPAGAVGMWQLMRGTAHGFGVTQNMWYDGRRDVYASTNAALDYLTYLQSYFGGDWMLAIAAYDTGEGNVQSAIRHNANRNLNTDFWSLSLANETRSYVPRLLALATIIRDPGKYNIVLPPVDDHPYLTQVNIGAPIDLAKAAQLANMSLADMKKLNPAYSRMTLAPTGPYRLVLPIDRVAIFKEQLEAMGSISRTRWGRYKVQHGDTLTSIAQHFHTSVSELREINHIKGHSAPAGKLIMIPQGVETITPHLDTTDNNQDNAQANDTSQQTTAVDNPLANMQEQNQQGQTDQLNQSDKSQQVSDDNNTNDEQSSSADDSSDDDTMQPVQQKHIYIVKHNDNLVSIAKHYKVKTSDLARWNKLKTNHIKPGMKLIIAPQKTNFKSHKAIKQAKPGMQSQSEHAVSQHKTAIRPDHYVVRSGDNLSVIAKRLGVKSIDLARWNQLTANASLKPGQKLVVH